jgi:predicted RecB family nuclease
MQLAASDFYTYLQPSKCPLRVYLRHIGKQESPPGPYEEVLRHLGERHEKTYLATFPSVVDLSSGTSESRERRTREEVTKGAQVIYQPALRAAIVLGKTDCEVVGDPDFLIRHDGRYIVRDSKISRRITEDDHPEILRQVEMYGWLYEQTFSQPPSVLQVHGGDGNIVDITYDGGKVALELLGEILLLRQAGSEPYSPVGWTKCDGCGFHDLCWQRARNRRDISMVSGVDQRLSIALHDKGIHSVDEFLSAFDERSLSELQRPSGNKTQRVGKKSKAIIVMAQTMASGKECILQSPAIPDRPSYVMFDLEGLPPQLDEIEKVYLWGFQVFGENPGDYQAATAGFGADGDRQGWKKFLANAKGVFTQYGDLPFVHWHHYEHVLLNKYVIRFGDPEGTAARVERNLLDLLPITKGSIALPLPSYSLKVVEQYVGFTRTQTEYGGDWAMAKYIEAIETQDEDLRAQILEQILLYNREDLNATWTVLQWLKSKTK